LRKGFWRGRHRQQAGGEAGGERMVGVDNINLSLISCRGPTCGLEVEVIFQGGLPNYNRNRAFQKLRSTRGGNYGARGPAGGDDHKVFPLRGGTVIGNRG